MLLGSKLNPILMGILNVTPDSFSDAGLHFNAADAIAHGSALLAQGAQIIDIGGEASGPGSRPCSAQEEFGRVAAVVKALAPQGIVSVDTCKADVARAALEQGAQIINDISGLRYDQRMVEVVREFNASVVIMFSKESSDYPWVTSRPGVYADVIRDIRDFLSERIEFALAAGLAPRQIILDPGLGRFVSDDAEYSWEIISRLEEFKRMFPEFRLLIGASRKGFMGGALRDRDPLSQLVGLVAAMRGVDIIRTHNVQMAHEFVRVWNKAYGVN